MVISHQYKMPYKLVMNKKIRLNQYYTNWMRDPVVDLNYLVIHTVVKAFASGHRVINRLMVLRLVVMYIVVTEMELKFMVLFRLLTPVYTVEVFQHMELVWVLIVLSHRILKLMKQVRKTKVINIWVYRSAIYKHMVSVYKSVR